MVNDKRHSTWYLVLRSFWPSTTSAVLCICFALAIEMSHLLLLSLSLGTSLPTVLDGQWALAYTQHVVDPLQLFFNNVTLNNILVVMLWGTAGLGTYFIIEYTIHFQTGLREAQKDVQMVGERQYVYHPMRKTFWLTVTWRSSILVLAAVIFITTQPWLQSVLRTDPRLVSGAIPLRESLLELTLSMVGWTILAHGFVVFLRLFLMRTRLFGDPAVE